MNRVDLTNAFGQTWAKYSCLCSVLSLYFNPKISNSSKRILTCIDKYMKLIKFLTVGCQFVGITPCNMNFLHRWCSSMFGVLLVWLVHVVWLSHPYWTYCKSVAKSGEMLIFTTVCSGSVAWRSFDEFDIKLRISKPGFSCTNLTSSANLMASSSESTLSNQSSS